MTTTYGVGDLAIVGWAVEATPGTPVAPTSYVPIDIGSSSPDFDPNRSAVDVAMGSPFTTIAVVDRKGKGTWSLKMQLYPTLGQDFLAMCGFTTGGLVAPQSFTLTQDYYAKSIAYPGCKCSKMVFDISATGVMVTVSGEFTGRPVVGSPLSAPSVSGQDPYLFIDLGAVTLISGATTNQDAESIQITVDFVLATGYGNSGVPLPSVLQLARFGMSGKIALFFDSTNYTEYADFIASGGVAGAINIPFVRGSHSAAIDILAAKYTKGPLTAPKDALDLVTLDFMAFSTTLTNYATYTSS